MGEVILGMPGPWAEDNHEASDHFTTKIGGLPDWPVPVEAIKTELLKCGVCGGDLILVAQVFAPISSNCLQVEERTLYVLGCPGPKCGRELTSWRTLRLQKSTTGDPVTSVINHDSAKPSASSGSISSGDNWWGGDAWITEGSGDELGNMKGGNVSLVDLSRAFMEVANASSHAHKQKDIMLPNSEEKKSASKQRTKVIRDSNTQVVPCFYLYSLKEPLLQDGLHALSSLSIKGSKEDPDNDQGNEELWEQEGYEYGQTMHTDRTYLKFKKCLDAFPEQCFRYCHGCRPLLAAKEVANPGNCALCGGPLHYEMQLMPPLLYYLREAGRDSAFKRSTKDWNWITLIVYTCAKSCSPPFDNDNGIGNTWFVAEETTILQYEESFEELDLLDDL
ncbi:programmed cell death protein 2-like isoform X2 [Amborella trichopoda]|uniref:Programmed cell death protein 2 C-terminal domain-containing protein n=2 Tax=Amborella trichopoda TaxID=13333 RepID=W1P080_AMBTC|nr:programmed cell death protein 2-like isoform X2 [Amborella trichopoda]ERN00971.1 hypothetical protein AMTR_s00002p00090480 [Amborella trichopoda]|eukprot:XP_006838402.1 programmed cell death protein 2-like isoform X2 [Amborella trichopoda]